MAKWHEKTKSKKLVDKSTVKKTKKLVLYLERKSRNPAVAINPTKVKNNKFVIKSPPKDYGVIRSYDKISDAELGREIRKAFKLCD